MAIEQALLDNQLLKAMPADEFKRIAGLVEPVVLRQGAVVIAHGEPVQHLYFPEDCLIALFAVADGDLALEVGLTGREGAAGAVVALGATVSPVRAVVQQAGRALRLPVAALLRLLAKLPVLQRSLLRHAETVLAQAVQTAVCSRFHMLEERLARVLLTTRDRLGASSFHLTHEFLAQALGVRRVGVTKAASTLQQLRLISYSRGDIHILDGAGLESAACTCYRASGQA